MSRTHLTTTTRPTTVRRLLLAALLTSAATAAIAAEPSTDRLAPTIVVRDDLLPDAPAPGGIVDVTPDINGVGQMVTDIGDGFIGLCTGTLINPRTVIFAAHCVNEEPAADYGAARGGTPISFGFKANNLPALRQWLGRDGAPAPYLTNTANALYNVEQVWYDPRSLAPGEGLNFLEGDVALATLDTPANDIPTWTLLFSPLTAPTHAVITGYGSRGNGTDGDIGIDFRRRSAENMISLLGSLDDVDTVLFGEPDGLPQSLYQQDFDDPKFGTAAANPFDFNIFGGAALPREGITAGGDSGGPLIADKAFNKPVVVGVLSGGSRYFEEQPFSSYGGTSFYQPLFLFWDQIVANNPYRYATNKAGDASWTDPKHWVQTMDPAYAIAGANGKLVNALPKTAALGVSGDTVKFGKVCFFDDCQDIGQAGTTGGAAPFIPGGPGSTNFVPNNITAAPGRKAQYFDVTLAALGRTTLTSSVRIDRLTIDGATILDVKAPGRLTVLGDFTQAIGWTNVDGVLKAGESLVVAGLLTGSGTIDPTYLTVIAAGVAPGGIGDLGTLTVKGDVILSSRSTLSIELNGTAADRLAVTGDAQNRGLAALGGTVIFTPVLGARPRQGQRFDFVTAQGGISGTFANAYSLLPGVLKADVSYGANAATATLKAGSFLDLLKSAVGTAKEVARFAAALDALRDGSYDKLYNLYGAIDLMDAHALEATLQRLAPSTATQARALQQAQALALTNVINDRLTDLGRPGGPRAGLSLIGAPEALMALAANRPSGSVASRQGMLSLASLGAPRALGTLPEGMSGFVASGYGYEQGNALTGTRAGRYGGLRTWNMAMGLERQIGEAATLGFAAGIAQGASGTRRSADAADSRTRQVALYGAARLGGGFYVAGLGAFARTTGDGARRLSGGDLGYALSARNAITSLDMSMEGGVNLSLGDALVLTPRAAVRHAGGRIAGYDERGGEAALAIAAQTFSRDEGRIGLKLAGTARIAGWRFEPRMQADWVRNLSGNEAGLVARFALAQDVAIALPGAARDGAWGELRGGFRMANGPIAFGLTADASMGRDELHENRALADFSYRF